MSKLGRVRQIITGIVIILYAVILLIEDPDAGMHEVAMIMSLTFTLRGMQGLIYYLSMARSMVGGKFTLLRALLILDLGVFTSSLTRGETVYVVLYLAGLHIFSALIDFLRTSETKKMGSADWKIRAAFGATNACLAILMLTGGFVMHSLRTVLYIYAAGLIYSGIMRIAAGFRRTAIVYIQ